MRAAMLATETIPVTRQAAIHSPEAISRTNAEPTLSEDRQCSPFVGPMSGSGSAALISVRRAGPAGPGSPDVRALGCRPGDSDATVARVPAPGGRPTPGPSAASTAAP